MGMRTGKKFRMGDTVKIRVVAANLDKRQLDYEWVPDGDKVQGSVPGGDICRAPAPTHNQVGAYLNSQQLLLS